MKTPKFTSTIETDASGAKTMTVMSNGKVVGTIRVFEVDGTLKTELKMR